MSLTINERVNYLNRVANLTITITLKTRAELATMTQQMLHADDVRLEPIKVALDNGQTHTTLPLANPEHSIVISYRDIVDANPGVDLSDAFVHYEAELHIDRTQSEPLYPSDMINVFRAAGMPEDEIQRLLDNERALRANQ